MSNQIQCLNPRIIVNPMLPDLLARFGNYTMSDGYIHHLRGRSAYSFFGNMSIFSHALAHVTVENIDEFYVVDEKTAETWPIYLQVPCNHCDACLARKMDAFSHRCLIESQCYDCLPWFLTLTYKPSKLPMDGLQVRDVQLFLKRFRIRLERMGYSRSFRYVAVGEYGSKFKRPHYHLIIWNLKPVKDFKYFSILRALRRSWNNGFVYNSIISPEYTARHHGKPEKCFEYVAKYVCKDSEVPEGKNPVFMCQSLSEGGIGSPFIRRHASYLRKSLNQDFKFVDQFSGKVRRLQFNSYIIDRLFPSFCRSVPYKLRSAVRQLCLSSSFIGHDYRFGDILKFKELYSPHIYFPLFQHSQSPYDIKLSASFCPAFDWCQRFIIDHCLDVLERYVDFDFRLSNDLASRRSVFLFNLFEHAVPKDLKDKAYVWRRHRELAKQREIL